MELFSCHHSDVHNFEVVPRFLENLSTITAAVTVTVVVVIIIVVVVIIIIIITTLLFLPDLTPKEDLYGNWKCLVIEAVIQGAASVHV